MSRDEFLASLLAERYGPPPVERVRPAPKTVLSDWLAELLTPDTLAGYDDPTSARPDSSPRAWLADMMPDAV